VEIACVSLWDWDFNPPLTTFVQSGSVHVTGSNICAVAQEQTSPLAAGAGPVIFSGAFDATYTGSCLLASLAPAGSLDVYTLVGGEEIVASFVSGPALVQMTATFADNVCVTSNDALSVVTFTVEDA
jgi:hypothetical protein